MKLIVNTQAELDAIDLNQIGEIVILGGTVMTDIVFS